MITKSSAYAEDRIMPTLMTDAVASGLLARASDDHGPLTPDRFLA
jgi:hypothetical protein